MSQRPSAIPNGTSVPLLGERQGEARAMRCRRRSRTARFPLTRRFAHDLSLWRGEHRSDLGMCHCSYLLCLPFSCDSSCDGE